MRLKDQNTVSAPDPSAVCQPVEDWSHLQGKVVSVWVQGVVVDHGRVDAVACNGSLLWLAMEGAAGRRLVEKHQDVNIELLSASPLITGRTD